MPKDTTLTISGHRIKVTRWASSNIAFWLCRCGESGTHDERNGGAVAAAKKHTQR